ncbi:methylated-DNA--[protein]-cysteine S-methyltransferase [Capillimicrobium parvum]|uniref:Methylated-DNA--protein-cysteine methyltransferase n=1 Tax=Capillimicrobium parvum TaxID=2884022 RepID=A0A9E6XUD0_9ACTN|nr:Methylated-DNA--protein-cysteine methyltransferase [Capillimicrobium parvum]
MTQMTTATIDSPIGPLSLTARDGALTHVHMHEQRHAAAPAPDALRDDAAFPEAVRQFAEYFAGERTAFDLALAPGGTPFQLRVWEALREIPYGETISYGELARRVGSPGAFRAVGLANGRNPLAIVVPCHRVIGADGGLTGYGGGLERKRWLLAHEAAHRPAPVDGQLQLQ